MIISRFHVGSRLFYPIAGTGKTLTQFSAIVTIITNDLYYARLVAGDNTCNGEGVHRFVLMAGNEMFRCSRAGNLRAKTFRHNP